jgi:hypothetical protein
VKATEKPQEKMRWIEVRGDVELGEEGVQEHLNRLANA